MLCLMQICQLISLNSVSVGGKWICNDCQIICLACLAAVWNGTLLMCYYSVSLTHTNDWKVDLYVYHGARHRNMLQWNDPTKDIMNHSFILDFHSLVFISSLQKHMILKYVENNETKLLPKRHNFSLPQCLKSYIVEKWVVIYLSWFPFRRILAKKSDKYFGTFGVYFIQKYFGKKKDYFWNLRQKSRTCDENVKWATSYSFITGI